MKSATTIACDRLLQCILLLLVSYYSVLNPVGGQLLTKSLICVAVSSRVAYVSGVECQHFTTYYTLYDYVCDK